MAEQGETLCLDIAEKCGCLFVRLTPFRTW